ncbi:MAG: FAD/NAD(P)-binding protein [Candidatus Odinarchaeota archaeon]
MTSFSSTTEAKQNIYQINMARVVRIHSETPDTNLYTFEYVNKEQQKKFSFTPGQFMLLSFFGHGEAPFGICSSPNQTESFDLCIRSVGRLTNALKNLHQESIVGLRGPFGYGWPMDELKGKNVVIIGGGIGLVPLRPVILDILENRDNYGSVQIMYGARCPEELLFKEDLYLWDNRRDIEYVATVDRDDEHCWAGNIGVVTILFDRITISSENTFALACGPPIMYQFVMRELEKIGLPDDRIFLSLERRMKCGVGHCSHCLVGTKFVCQDGPVFSYKVAKTLRGAV